MMVMSAQWCERIECPWIVHLKWLKWESLVFCISITIFETWAQGKHVIRRNQYLGALSAPREATLFTGTRTWCKCRKKAMTLPPGISQLICWEADRGKGRTGQPWFPQPSHIHHQWKAECRWTMWASKRHMCTVEVVFLQQFHQSGKNKIQFYNEPP